MQLLNASFVCCLVCNLFTSTSACQTLEEKKIKGGEFLRHALFCMCFSTCTVDKTTLALFLYFELLGLTRQWHAPGGNPSGRACPTYFCPIGSGAWAEQQLSAGLSVPELWADGPRLRVPHTREPELLLYAGRQRAEAFLSPEKTAHSRFPWITRKLEKSCSSAWILEKAKLCSNGEREPKRH